MQKNERANAFSVLSHGGNQGLLQNGILDGLTEEANFSKVRFEGLEFFGSREKNVFFEMQFILIRFVDILEVIDSFIQFH